VPIFPDNDSAPHDTLTNAVTGESIVVRGEFSEFIERIAGTDEFTKTVVGHRYMVTEPGLGVTIRDVGRIVYGDLEQTIVLWQAGKHDLALDAAIEGPVSAAWVNPILRGLPATVERLRIDRQLEEALASGAHVPSVVLVIGRKVAGRIDGRANLPQIERALTYFTS
jgi:hypothetical protein